MTTGRDAPKCHADLLDLAKTLRRKLSTLFTLGDANDPFVADHTFRSKHAYWIADLFERFEIRIQVEMTVEVDESHAVVSASAAGENVSTSRSNSPTSMMPRE